MTAIAGSIEVIEVFCSYAHEDEDLKKELDKHLSVIERQNLITLWSDRSIDPGADWKGEISEHLDTAEVVLLLISADFVASRYCYDVEMARALDRHKKGECRAIPVSLRQVDWEGMPFAKLQALPKDAKPITSWNNRDEAFTDVVRGIRRVVVQLRKSKTEKGSGTEGAKGSSDSEIHAMGEWMLSLSVRVNAIQRPVLEGILHFLRRLIPNSQLSLWRIEPGSTIFVFHGTRDGFETIHSMIQSGELNEISGFAIQGAEWGTDLKHFAEKIHANQNTRSIFTLSQKILQDYAKYVQSFLSISDDRIRSFVEGEFIDKASLWPEPLLQVNPTYEHGGTIDELCNQGQLHPLCAKILYDDAKQNSIRLFHHQHEAIQRGLARKPFVVTSGTGSGKTLTYFTPIFDAVLKQNSNQDKVRAIIVYPMNALVNSQLHALEQLAENYKQREGRDLPIRFAKYTGQESEARKQDIQSHPPHILLSNYVMLELMLVRPEERVFIDQATSALEFLVFDELHTYRGRQGADVALLIRRLKERCGNPNLLTIGTSATMVAGKGMGATERRQAVAEFASKIFGTVVQPENVIEERLRRLTDYSPIDNDLRRALGEPISQTIDQMLGNPLTAWIEENFGFEQESDGNLRRRTPTSLQEVSKKLSELTTVDEGVCQDRLREMFLHGSQIATANGNPLFGFKLHHFIAQGRTVYTTLEKPQIREFSAQGQYYAKSSQNRILYPLGFCRVCGQDYYSVLRNDSEKTLVPWESDNDLAENSDAIAGYVMVSQESPEFELETEHLPADWLNSRGRVKPEYRDFVPVPLWVRADGRFENTESKDALKVWFQPKPFMLCLNCGEYYTRRDKNDFRKLARLSSEGRSTTTTILTTSALTHAPEGGIAEGARKLLSFTDNRQDASLQAGHFNDFVQVSLLRAAIYAALEGSGSLRHDSIATSVLQNIGLELVNLARNRDLDLSSPQARAVWDTFRDLLEYRVYEDLRRGWRVVQPNLEQCGLVKIEYQGLDSLCADIAKWQHLEPFATLSTGNRKEIVSSLLNHLRRKFAINAPCLQETALEQLYKRVQQHLNRNWSFDENERIRPADRFVLPNGDNARISGLSLSTQSLVGRYLRRTLNIQSDTYDGVLTRLVDVLCAQGLLLRGNERGTDFVQLDASSLIWRVGDGTPPVADPIYSRRVASPAYQESQRRANDYFREFYQHGARALKGIEGREHTAQVKYADREDREKRFGRGDLSCLFCSPTMELGIDIRDLQIVHMRNMPPTPANYAQRSGRAGRHNDPALVITYCAAQSGHDQYFFKNREKMVAGAVRAPRLDLSNQDLVRAHVHAIWLAKVSLPLGNSIADLLDLGNEIFPLTEGLKIKTELSERSRIECLHEAKRILRSCEPDISASGWYSDDWLSETLRRASEAFDSAFERWRELYRAAQRERKLANDILDRPQKDKRLRQDAERQRSEAERQMNLLCNFGTTREESDFYPYRYLASEGFLPGYNFPRLPIRAFIPREDGEYIARPRFLAITEFGPQNIVYHEGTKYRCEALLAPPGGLEQQRLRAKTCRACGYFLDDTGSDVCVHCGTRLDASNSEVLPLLAMSNVKTVRRERITCDEEERRRLGYEMTTHYSFAPTASGQDRQSEADVLDVNGQPVLRLVYAPTATLYRVNHGWRNRREKGFAINLRNGDWLNNPDPDDQDQTPASNNNVQRDVVRLFVRDTQNILLFKITSPELRNNDNLMATLQYALQRGIETTFQVEESELATERIGSGEHRAILFWEAAEGGVGVLRRLLEERDIVAQIARAALERCHFDPVTLEDKGKDCARACYDCVLSYSNQRDHARLDRQLIKDLLVTLAQSITQTRKEGRSYNEHYQWLRSLTDSRSELERRFLDRLYQTQRRLPDEAQKALSDYYAIPDFFYTPNVCVFCDGSVHDGEQQKTTDATVRRELKEKGYRIVVIRYDQDLEEQMKRYADILGEGKNI